MPRFCSVSDSGSSSVLSIFSSMSGVRWRLSIPSMATEIAPVSSDTMTTTASECSLMPMPARCLHTEVTAQAGVLGEREHTARRSKPALADYYSAVMQWSLDKKDVPQQLTGDVGVDDGAGCHLFIEAYSALKDDQRTGARLRHGGTGKNRLGNHRLKGQRRRASTKEKHEPSAAHTLKQAAQLRLEDDDQRNKTELNRRFQQRVYHPEFEEIRQPECQQDDDYTTGQPRRVCAADEPYCDVNERGDEDDIDDIRDLRGRHIFYGVGDYSLEIFHKPVLIVFVARALGKAGARQFVIVLYNNRLEIATTFTHQTAI